MRLAMVPVAGIVQRNESLFFKLDKGALGCAFGYAQRLDRLIHRKPDVAVVAAIETGVQFQPDLDSCPRNGPPSLGFDLRVRQGCVLPFFVVTFTFRHQRCPPRSSLKVPPAVRDFPLHDRTNALANPFGGFFF